MNIVRVPLADGNHFLIDEDDVDLLSGPRWQANHSGSTIYVQRMVMENGVRFRQSLHRLVLGVTDPTILIDHLNRDGLDNRRSNLRACTPEENVRNVGVRRDSTSGFKGVSFDKTRGRWHAYIRVGGKRQHLGYFEDRDEAATAYNRRALQVFGGFAFLNPLTPAPDAPQEDGR